uniref:Cyclic nucleotide-binding domain-containing protein n=1 Tax=Lotharella globosa TaxID=91324 RepID=A0A7S3Z437_9EUKA
MTPPSQHSTFRRFWDTVTCMLLVVLAVVLPLSLAFKLKESRAIIAIEWAQTIWFLLDVPLNFITTIYSDHKGTVKSHKKIFRKYFFGWFAIDLASSLPIDWMVDTPADSSSLAQGLKLLKFFKLLRLLRVDRILVKWQLRNQVKFSTIAICKFLMMLLTGAHWLGLIFWLISIESGCSQPYCSWVLTYAQDFHYYSPIDGQCFSDAMCNEWPLSSKYILCIYWAITTMSTIGFGDVTPKNEAEMVFTLFAMLCGTVCFAHGLTNMCSILFYNNKFQVDNESIMDELIEFFSRHGIGRELGSKIQNYMFYKNNMKHFDPTAEKFALELSQPLAERLKSHLLKTAFPRERSAAKFMIFNLYGCQSRLFKMMANVLHSECHQESEFLVLKGDRLNKIYFVVDGQLAYTDSKNVNKEVSVNASMGELQGVVHGYKPDPSMSIRCLTDVTLFSVKPSQFKKVLKKFDFIWRAYHQMQVQRAKKRYPDVYQPWEVSPEIAAFLGKMGEAMENRQRMHEMFIEDVDDGTIRRRRRHSDFEDKVSQVGTEWRQDLEFVKDSIKRPALQRYVSAPDSTALQRDLVAEDRSQFRSPVSIRSPVRSPVRSPIELCNIPASRSKFINDRPVDSKSTSRALDFPADDAKTSASPRELADSTIGRHNKVDTV